MDIPRCYFLLEHHQNILESLLLLKVVLVHDPHLAVVTVAEVVQMKIRKLQAHSVDCHVAVAQQHPLLQLAANSVVEPAAELKDCR